ncbi:DUF2867 domain-containing protein [Hymenobacter lucidus]|uniref:DUF2867 domain-containing protein n=1 Tax=Hymenobacter lucidus TaxID=2880930 RepID=A0ABS8ATK2_9BACT|nr:DUF2867 domain-containing protein [Hymenobacter lucidus]MCB2409106.1 DUF2867 domain-containing protein [Hymenobacter lucidus]
MSKIKVVAVALPAASALAATTAPANYSDAYQVALPASAAHQAADATWLLFGHAPAWVQHLMQLRDSLVRPFRLKTSPPATPRPDGQRLVPGSRLGPFQVFSVAPHEVILGQDDRHLDFRVSVLLTPSGPATVGVVSTVVWFHNWFGRGYFAVVRPLHRLVVPALLRNALRQVPGHSAAR